MQDVLVCIRHNTTLDEAEHLCRSNSEYYLKSAKQMAALFRDYPHAITNTVKIAEQCRYQLQYGLQDLPVFATPNGMNATQFLRKLCLRSAQQRYGDMPSRIQDRFDYELRVIEHGHLSNYFLIVWDIIRFARDNQIRCQGRGSAANSLVAYLLDITPVDPLEHNLVFERFLSNERRMTPDIDIDFDAERREEVIQYVYQRYGHDHAAMASTLVTFRRRMAVLEDAGLIKIDILGLRMLSAVAEAASMAEALTGNPIKIDRLHFDDTAVYAMISQADTVGVFQVESRAQAQMIPRFKPTKFTDLIVAISLIRPGPIQGDMVHPYLRRRLGTEPVTYPHPLLEDTLKDTLGIILFQEDVIKVARDLAGFTPGQGELLRRALGSKNATEAIAAMHHDFITGAAKKGATEAIAEAVFEKLCAFGSYSFPKSHAAAFAVLVYQSAWLKCYHPVAFYIAILNNQPMGFWTPAIVTSDQCVGITHQE